MAYHNIVPYKKKSTTDINTRVVSDVTAEEQTQIDSIISRFVTKFKAKHLS